jgi:hypothetical protein
MSKADNIKQYYANKHKEKKHKERNLAYATSLRNNKYLNLENHIWENMINRINNAFITQNAKRIYKYEELIGCSKTELLEYLTSINISSVEIELYPSWEPDHIIPVSSFNLKDINEQKECFNFKNLQILSKHDNRVKYNKL